MRDHDGRAKLHADIAHPINSACREIIQSAVIKSYQDERIKARLPGYVCTYDDYDSDFDEGFPAPTGDAATARVPAQVRSHGPHGPRPTHMNPTEAPASRPTTGDNFGAGII